MGESCSQRSRREFGWPDAHRCHGNTGYSGGPLAQNEYGSTICICLYGWRSVIVGRCGAITSDVTNSQRSLSRSRDLRPSPNPFEGLGRFFYISFIPTYLSAIMHIHFCESALKMFIKASLA